MLLNEHTAAVELLNIAGPTVAVAWFVSFAALALHQQPGWRDRLGRDPDAALDGDLDGDLEAFAHEVRWRYPFTRPSAPGSTGPSPGGATGSPRGG